MIKTKQTAAYILHEFPSKSKLIEHLFFSYLLLKKGSSLTIFKQILLINLLGQEKILYTHQCGKSLKMGKVGTVIV